MPKLTRREFAKLLALSLGAGVGRQRACRSWPAPPAPPSPPPPPSTPTCRCTRCCRYGAMRRARQARPRPRAEGQAGARRPQARRRRRGRPPGGVRLRQGAPPGGQAGQAAQARPPPPRPLHLPRRRRAAHAAPATDNIAFQNLKTTYPRTDQRPEHLEQQQLPVARPGRRRRRPRQRHQRPPRPGQRRQDQHQPQLHHRPPTSTATAPTSRGSSRAAAAGDAYVGMAPDCTLLSVKIANDQGVATQADLLRGLQWAYDNRATYNIRAVNVSMTTGTAESYKTSPVCAAVEQLWFNGVLTVVAAGNRGNVAQATWYPPANDPYVITVGALDDNGTTDNADNRLAAFSSRGTTQDGYRQARDRRPRPPDRQHPRAPPAARSRSNSPTGSPTASTSGCRGPRWPRRWWRASSPSSPRVPARDARPGQVAAGEQRQPTRPAGRGQARRGLHVPLHQKHSAIGQPGPHPEQRHRRAATPSGANGYWDQAYWDQAYWDQAYWDVTTSYD